MYNKKVLREATKNLNRTVAPAKKKNVIVDQEGQRKYPGQITKIMGDTMSTDGYGYIPLMVYPNNGQPPQLVEPNTGPRYFPGATEFTEFPVTKAYGGDISIPDLNQYEDGGEYDLTDEEIAELKAGGYIVEELPKAQLGLIKSPYQLPAGTKHPMQVPAKKPTVKPTRTYDPLRDVKPQVSESTKPINTTPVDKNLADKIVAQKAAQRQATVEAVKQQPLLSQEKKSEILMDPRKLEEYDYLTRMPDPGTVTQKKEQSWGDRLRDYTLNPDAAIYYAMSDKDMPNNYQAMIEAGIDPMAGEQGGNTVLRALNTNNPLVVANEVKKATDEGNYGEAGFGLLGFIPGFKQAKTLKKGLDVADAVSDVKHISNISDLKRATLKDEFVDLNVLMDHLGKQSDFATDQDAIKFIKEAQKNYTKSDNIMYDYINSRDWGFPNNYKAVAHIIKNDLHPPINSHMYHGTTSTRLKDIMSRGLDNSLGDELNPGVMTRLNKGETTAAGDIDYARGFANTAAEKTKGSPVILRFPNVNNYNIGYIGEHPSPSKLEYSLDDGKTWLTEYKKGGSFPDIPKKKGSKGYSRSLLATNQLFAQNPLLKKPKSKKRKIFDPNAKYYQVGGERDTIWNQNLAKDDKEFQDWYWNNSQALEAGSGIPYSEDFAYDYYSYFKNKDHLDTQGNPTDHYIDKYKRPQHPVFSDQSLYSTPENPGGHWETINGQEVLIPHQGLSLTKRNKKLGGFQDDINKHRDLIRDWTYGESIGMLEKAQKGKRLKFKRLSREEEEAARFNQEQAMQAKAMPAQAPVETTVPEQSFDYWAGGPGIYPTEKDLPEIRVSPNTGDLPTGHWLRYKREFMKTTPYEDFATERRKKYLRRTNPGLNKLFGISEKNYPEAAERRIKAAYDEKMNTYIFERMGQDLGFNPKDRTTWVDQITDPSVASTPEMRKVYEIVANSKYGSKLDPSVWSKFLSGAQQTANILLPKEIELNKKIPGYTEKENYEAQTSWSEPLNVFEPTYLMGNYFANLAYGTKEIAGTEGRTRPDLMTGQLNPEVSPYASLITDPTLPFQLVSNPTKFIGKGIVEGAKTTGKVIQGTRLAAGSKKGYEKIVKPTLQTISKTLDTPLGKGTLAQSYQRNILGLPEWQVAFNAAQAPKTAIQEAATPASILRAQTMGTGVANIPTFGRAVKRDYNIIMDDNTTFADKTSAMRDMSRNIVMQGLSMSPFIGKYGEQVYGSVPATYAFLIDNLSKVTRNDPEAARSLLNLSRLVPTRKDGGNIVEINDRTRTVLAKLGYQIEDID